MIVDTVSLLESLWRATRERLFGAACAMGNSAQARTTNDTRRAWLNFMMIGEEAQTYRKRKRNFQMKGWNEKGQKKRYDFI